MSSLTIITGNYLEAMEGTKSEVVVSFMTERGILWGFSKNLAEALPEVDAMTRVDHGAHIGQFQHRVVDGRTHCMAYISAPEAQAVYQNLTVGGLYDNLKSIMQAMAKEGKKRMMLQYPGMSVCGRDIYGFNSLLAEARAGLDIDIFVNVNPVIGSKYQPRAGVHHYDSRSRVRLHNHMNFQGAANRDTTAPQFGASAYTDKFSNQAPNYPFSKYG